MMFLFQMSMMTKLANCWVMVRIGYCRINFLILTLDHPSSIVIPLCDIRFLITLSHHQPLQVSNIEFNYFMSAYDVFIVFFVCIGRVLLQTYPCLCILLTHSCYLPTGWLKKVS